MDSKTIIIFLSEGKKHMDLEEYFRNTRLYVWRETFAIMKSRKPCPGAFANIVDKNETTVIIEQSKVRDKDIIEIEKGWKIITFDTILPFGLVGFLARVSRALAEEKIPIFAVSAYSTDHILVKQEDLPGALKKLESLGCIIEKE